MKKKIIIIIIIVAIIAVAVWVYLKGKKSAAVPVNNSLTSNSGLSSPTATNNGTSVQTNAVNAPSPNPGGTPLPYTGVQLDKSKGMAIICYQPISTPLKVGDVINIPSGPYAGQSKIWYIYDFQTGGYKAGPGQNLYIDKPFVNNETGTFYKV